MTARRADFLEEPSLRFALSARPTASQGFAAAGSSKKSQRWHFGKIRSVSNKEADQRRGVYTSRRDKGQVGPNESIKRGQIKLTNAIYGSYLG